MVNNGEKKLENSCTNRYVKLFENAFEIAEERNFDKIYVVVDVHNTILLPNYDGIANEYYPLAPTVLQHLSKREDVVLIMWTCSTKEDREIYNEFFKKDGIHFDYINENPEVAGKVQWGDFDTKMYANVILDDKAGFFPETDWHDLLNYFACKCLEEEEPPKL
jgi:hypothetical protein